MERCKRHNINLTNLILVAVLLIGVLVFLGFDPEYSTGVSLLRAVACHMVLLTTSAPFPTGKTHLHFPALFLYSCKPVTGLSTQAEPGKRVQATEQLLLVPQAPWPCSETSASI